MHLELKIHLELIQGVQVERDLEKAGQAKGGSITVSSGAPQSEQKRPATSGGRAKQTIANVATRRDAAVADVLEMAQSEADKRTAAKKQELASRLGAQMASSEIQAIEEVANFFLRTLGNSQWLLSGVQEVLEGELVD